VIDVTEKTRISRKVSNIHSSWISHRRKIRVYWNSKKERIEKKI